MGEKATEDGSDDSSEKNMVEFKSPDENADPSPKTVANKSSSKKPNRSYFVDKSLTSAFTGSDEKEGFSLLGLFGGEATRKESKKKPEKPTYSTFKRFDVKPNDENDFDESEEALEKPSPQTMKFAWASRKNTPNTIEQFLFPDSDDELFEGGDTFSSLVSERDDKEFAAARAEIKSITRLRTRRFQRNEKRTRPTIAANPLKSKRSFKRRPKK